MGSVLRSTHDGEFPMTSRGGCNLAAGSAHLAVLYLTQTTKISRQIIKTDCKQVHAVDGRDGFGILDAATTLQQGLDHCHAIDHGSQLAGGHTRKPVMRQEGYLRTLTARRKTGRIDDRLCLRNRLYSWCDDPTTTAVQYAPYNSILSLGSAHPGLEPQVTRGRGDLYRNIDWHAAVLKVNPDDPVAGRAGHARNVSGTRLPYAECQNRLSSRQPADDAQWCLPFHADMVRPPGPARQFNFPE